MDDGGHWIILLLETRCVNICLVLRLLVALPPTEAFDICRISMHKYSPIEDPVSRVDGGHTERREPDEVPHWQSLNAWGASEITLVEPEIAPQPPQMSMDYMYEGRENRCRGTALDGELTWRTRDAKVAKDAEDIDAKNNVPEPVPGSQFGVGKDSSLRGAAGNRPTDMKSAATLGARTCEDKGVCTICLAEQGGICMHTGIQMTSTSSVRLPQPEEELEWLLGEGIGNSESVLSMLNRGRPGKGH